MAEIVDLCAVRAERARAQFLAQPIEPLLHGPITDAMVDAFEFLTDAELEVFFRARARAKLDRLRAERPNSPKQS